MYIGLIHYSYIGYMSLMGYMVIDPPASARKQRYLGCLQGFIPGDAYIGHWDTMVISYIGIVS